MQTQIKFNECVHFLGVRYTVQCTGTMYRYSCGQQYISEFISTKIVPVALDLYNYGPAVQAKRQDFYFGAKLGKCKLIFCSRFTNQYYKQFLCMCACSAGCLHGAGASPGTATRIPGPHQPEF